MSSENRFFEEVKGRLENYTPEAPAEVFGMARNQFLTRRFFRFNVQHFNIWYVGVVLTGVTAAVLISRPRNESMGEATHQMEIPSPQIAQPSVPDQVAEQMVVVPEEKTVEVKRKKPAITTDAVESVPAEEPVVVEEANKEEVSPSPSPKTQNSKSLNVKVLKTKE